MDFTEQINQLTQQLTVKKKAAERFLTVTNGSIEEAIKLYEEEMETLFVSRTQCQKEEAKKYLSLNQYNLGQAINVYEKDRYSPVEYVITRIRERKKALYSITSHISDVYENNKDLKNNPESYSVYESFFIIKRWIDYYGWEGDFLWDLERDMEVVYTLKNVLGFTLLADKLKAVRDKYEELEKQQVKNIWEEQSLNELEKSLRETFDSQEKYLLEALYDFVLKNIRLFCF